MQRSNITLLFRSLLLFTFLLAVCSYLFYLPYKVVRKSTIDSLNAQQFVLAKQGAQGIKVFFHHYEKVLNYLGQKQDIIHLNAAGKQLMQNIFQINAKELLALTRVDAAGRITYTVPFKKESIGKDISQQPHNAFILKHHQPVVSDVFRAVQGYPAVAYAIPLFDGGDYAGCISILIPFDVIAGQHLEIISLGEDGYAWMLDRSGVELYCPVPGHTGKTIYETSSQFTTVIDMAEKMMHGEQGATSYVYDRVRGKEVQTVVKHAVYTPVELPNNIWSIVVATPEDKALAAVKEFGKWWITIFGIAVSGISVYVFFLIRSRFVTKEGMQKQLREEKLRESERLFREIISNAHIPMVIVNFKGEIEHVNRKFTELYGYSREHIPTVDKWFEQAYPDPTYREPLHSHWQKHLHEAILSKNVSAFPNLELEITCKNGTNKLVYFEYTLFEDRLLITIIDRTEQRNIEKERERLQQRENQAKKIEVVGLMAGSVAHDLNNILSGIVSYPDILLTQISTESPLRKPLLSIKESGIRAATVVEDLLTAARGAAISRKPADLNQLIDEYVSSPEHQKIIELHPWVKFEIIKNTEKAWTACSPVHIKKSIMNLITNSAEAIKDKGTISLITNIIDIDTNNDLKLHPGKYVEFIVEDSGCGMRNEDIDRIFEPFYTRKIMGRSGTGLGLTIVWNTVHNHDGHIYVSSSSKGTKFTLLFPLLDDLVEIDHAISSKDESMHGNSEHILVVDDEETLRDIACQILGQYGYVVNSAASGEESIEFIKKNNVDLVLLDMVMEPGMNGRETYTELLKINPAQKAIIVSGYSQDIEMEKATKLGVRKFLKKPYTRNNLLQAVKTELSA